jgi:hypothetical protein
MAQRLIAWRSSIDLLLTLSELVQAATAVWKLSGRSLAAAAATALAAVQQLPLQWHAFKGGHKGMSIQHHQMVRRQWAP